MSLSRQIHIKLLWASFLLMQQIQQHFLSCEAVYKFFYGLSLFSVIIQGVQLTRKAEFKLTQSGSSVKQ